MPCDEFAGDGLVLGRALAAQVEVEPGMPREQQVESLHHVAEAPFPAESAREEDLEPSVEALVDRAKSIEVDEVRDPPNPRRRVGVEAAQPVREVAVDADADLARPHRVHPLAVLVQRMHLRAVVRVVPVDAVVDPDDRRRAVQPDCEVHRRCDDQRRVTHRVGESRRHGGKVHRGRRGNARDGHALDHSGEQPARVLDDPRREPQRVEQTGELEDVALRAAREHALAVPVEEVEVDDVDAGAVGHGEGGGGGRAIQADGGLAGPHSSGSTSGP